MYLLPVPCRKLGFESRNCTARIERTSDVRLLESFEIICSVHPKISMPSIVGDIVFLLVVLTFCFIPIRTPSRNSWPCDQGKTERLLSLNFDLFKGIFLYHGKSLLFTIIWDNIFLFRG